MLKQQLFYAEGHWVAVQAQDPKQGEVLLMDSLGSSLSDSLILQLAQYVYNVTLHWMGLALPLQLFFSNSRKEVRTVGCLPLKLCSGQDPTRASFKQCKCNSICITALRQEHYRITMYPSKDTVKTSMLITVSNDVFCSCNLFDKYIV